MPDESRGKKRLGRLTKGFGAGGEVSREALEREAAAEMGLIARDEPFERDEPPTSTTAPDRRAPSQRARTQWSRLRGALSTESDAARRERLEREAAEEMRLDPRRPELDDDD